MVVEEKIEESQSWERNNARMKLWSGPLGWGPLKYVSVIFFCLLQMKLIIYVLFSFHQSQNTLFSTSNNKKYVKISGLLRPIKFPIKLCHVAKYNMRDNYILHILQ